MTRSKLPTLIFIHYFGGNAGSWRWVGKRLSKQYNCVFLTLPGFGNSDPLHDISIRTMSEWIANEIRNLNAKNYILIGHSMGAKLALFTTFILHDLLPEKIILIAPSPPTRENMSESDKERMLNHPNREEAEETVRRSIQKKIKKRKFQYAVDSQLEVDKDTWKWWLNDGMCNDITWAIKNLNIATYVVYSANDPVITIDTIQQEVLPYLKEAKLISFGKSGHLIPIESSRKVSKVLKRFIKA